MEEYRDSFPGYERLKSIGAAWFVSCAYHDLVDPSHKNFESCATLKSRYSTYANTKQYHPLWLRHILQMNDLRLSRNSFHLSAGEIKTMAEEILKTF